MQQGQQVPPFFPEPQLPDPTWAASGESTVDWITRSTLPRARNVRRFLNHNLEKLPPDQRKPFAHNLRSRWGSALFELVVARLLQGLGGDLEIEVLNNDHRRPDFSLSFGASRFTIEAVAPKFDLKTAAKQKQDAGLIEIVERNAPPAWSLFLTELPDIGPAESKVPLKKLGPSVDKRRHFHRHLEERLTVREYPHLTFGDGPAKAVRYFPDKLPIGTQPNGDCHVFVYLVTHPSPMDFRLFLLRHTALLQALRQWTVRLLFPRQLSRARLAYQHAARELLGDPAPALSFQGVGVVLP